MYALYLAKVHALPSKKGGLFGTVENTAEIGRITKFDNFIIRKYGFISIFVVQNYNVEEPYHVERFSPKQARADHLVGVLSSLSNLFLLAKQLQI